MSTSTADPSPPTFQVLSLDGGGYKGIFSAAVLASIEEAHGVVIADHFDLIVGTSTGGIIALGLAAGKRPYEIVHFYVTHGPKIFPQSSLRKARWFLRSKFSPRPLRKALEEVLGDRQLIDAQVPLVIPSYDLESSDVHLFKTRHHHRLKYDWRLRMVDVALATSAAPTYFPTHRIEGIPLIDGGVWANNPTMVGVVEAVSLFGIALQDVRVLSIGTTLEVRRRKDKLYRGGAVAWRKDAIDVALNGQSAGSTAMARHLLGERHVIRINPTAPEDAFALDGLDTANLIGRAMRSARFDSSAVEPLLHHVPSRPSMLNERPLVEETRPPSSERPL